MLAYDELIKEVISDPRSIEAVKIRYEAKVAKSAGQEEVTDPVDLESTVRIEFIEVNRAFIISTPEQAPEDIIKTVDYALDYVKNELDRFYGVLCPRDIHYYHFTIIHKKV